MIKKLYGELGAYKGSNGKTATIGGSFEYTGAPYYAAISSLKAVRIIQGGDLAHVFCTKSSGTAIKAYSPALIVHPLLRSSAEEPELLTHSAWREIADEAVELSSKWFHAVHSVIIGPGLGRDSYLNEQIIPRLFQAARNQGIL